MTPDGAVTWLFVPGDLPGRFEKALASGADMVLLDLQDAVAADSKGLARHAVTAWLAAGSASCVRINPVPTAEGQDDLRALALLEATARPAAVMVPLAESADQLEQVTAALPGVPVVPLLESARGLAALDDLCGHPATRRVAFGNLDMAADLRCPPHSPLLDQVRGRLVLASRIAGLAPPVDGVTPQYHDDARARDEAAASRLLGFGGKLCVHPRQVPVVSAAFAPDPDEVDWARRVLAAQGDPRAGVGSVDGAMVDAPVLRRAQHVLTQAGRLGGTSADG